MKRIKMKVYYNIVHVSEYIENYEYFFLIGASLVTQMVKNLPAMKETWVQSLGQEDPLEKGMDTPVFLPREFHGQRNLAGYSPWSHKQSDTTKRLNTHTTFQKLGTI